MPWSPDPSSGEAHPASPSLLLVDDEAALRSKLARQLQARGYRVDLLFPALSRLAVQVNNYHSV